MTPLETFTKFMADPEAWDMYITGHAGTGKTTQLRNEVEYCIEQEIPYVVCAYTHRACDILRTKLPEGAIVTTLHSFLKKRPTINQHAVSTKQIDSNKQLGKPKRPAVIFIDEYSMIGEKDGIDIVAEQDPEYEGGPAMKVVWLGDPNQLPPVGDMPYVTPYGDYKVTLTKQWRNDNELQTPLNELINMLNGGDPAPLTTNSRFIRGKDIVEDYIELRQGADEHDVMDQMEDVVLLAYTNQRVESINAQIQGYDFPHGGERLFSPTTKQNYKYLGLVEDPDYIDTPFNGDVHKGSKYKTLEHLIKAGHCQFAEVEDSDGNILTVAFTFGHYQSKIKIEELKQAAAESNANIERKHPQYKAAGWAKNNQKTKLARARAKAWRDFLSYDECVICLDFPHAMTVHKSQGSTFECVCLDTEDLYKCANTNWKLYLKLMYVGISRASHTVITN